MKVILLRYGEIFLKGNNRQFFESTLIKNIKHSLKEYQFDIKKIGGRYEISNYPEENEVDIVDKLTKIFGIHSLSIATKLESEEQLIIDAVKQLDLNNKTFKVETKRASKIFPIHSMEFNSLLGDVVLKNFQGAKVDIHNPQVTIKVDIRENGFTYISTNDVPCADGMPLGTAGKGLLLLSGGIDSPVAGYFMGRRGLEIEAIHFHSYPYTSELARQKVLSLVEKMKDYLVNINLHIISVTEIQETLNKNCDKDYMITLLRRMMMRISQKIAEREGVGALITGESLGQVASQTLQSINATNAVVDIPVFRPLIGFDKQDIMNVSRKIGTYEISILPYEDCCTVFLPKNPVTKPKLDRVLKEESKLDIEKLINNSLATEEILKL